MNPSSTGTGFRILANTKNEASSDVSPHTPTATSVNKNSCRMRDGSEFVNEVIKYMFEIMAKNIILFIYLFASKNT